MLFGVVAAFLAHAGIKPEMQRLSLIPGLLHAGSFMMLAMVVVRPSMAVLTVFKVDVAALVPLLAAGAAHLRASAA